MEDLLSKRIVLVTGKGGVGRTALTAAIAHAGQRAGKRVLVTEMVDARDDYSALAELFGRNQLPSEAQEVAPGILGSKLVADLGVEQFLTSVFRVGALARTAVSFEPLRRLLSAAPSFKEMGIFQHLLSYLRQKLPDGRVTHELIVIDMPATGHALALTALPAVLLKVLTRGPIPAALREGLSYLNDPKIAAAYVVTLPEALPVSEALELVDGLKKTSMPVGGLILNRVPDDPFTVEEREAVAVMLRTRNLFGADGFRRMQEAGQAFDRLETATSLRVLVVPELEHEGADLVAAITQTLIGQRAEAAGAQANRRRPGGRS